MLTALLLLCVQEPPAEPPRPEVAEDRFLPDLHGTLSARYRLRATSDESDQDLYEFLNARYGDPEKDEFSSAHRGGASENTFALILTMRMAEDLDGDRRVDGFNLFDSRDDTFQHGWNARLYALYAQWRLQGARLRAGRQTVDELPEALPIDGLSVLATPAAEVRIGLFGGKPVNLYESETAQDLAGGGWVAVEPWTGAMARLEYLHLKDENQFGLFRDDLVGLTLEQRWGAIRAWGRATALESEARDATLRLTAATPDLVVDASATYLFEQVQALSFGIDPFATFLLPLEPYVQGTLRVSKPIGGRFGVDAVATAKRLTSEGDEGAYNHEFTRLSLVPHSNGWPFADVSLSIAADWWRSTADDFWTLGGDATWKAHPKLTLGVGTSFALWTLDEITGEERERVRIGYATAKWKAAKDLVIDAKASVETSDLDTITTLSVGVRRDF